MLSAFSARPVIELRQRDKTKIECLLAYGDRVLVGLSTGTLRIYRLHESLPSSPDAKQKAAQEADATDLEPADLLREEEKFSKKPVLQLAVVKEANTLISLSDTYVSFHSLQNYGLVERLERSKGATAFAMTSNIVKDDTTGIPSIVTRLAVAVKRKIIIWSWHDGELLGASEELTLAAVVKSVTWTTGSKIVAGMDPGYVIVDILTQEISDITKPAAAGEVGGATGIRFGAVNSSGMSYMGMGNWVPKPMATNLSEGQMLLAKDVNTLFVDDGGKALEKRQIPWIAAPEAIGYSYPYLLALHLSGKGALEVRNPETLSLLQSIALPSASIMHVPQPNISLAHAGKGFLVANERCIWRMGALNYESQIDQLLEKSLFDEALSLVDLLEDTLLDDKTSRLREIKMQKAQAMFDQRKYRDALDLFSEASAPPARVIALYPKTIAGSLHTKPTAHGSRHKRNKSSTSSKSSPEAKQADTTPQSSNLDDKDLMVAAIELNAFLAQSRVQLQRYVNYDGSLKDLVLEQQSAAAREGQKPLYENFIFGTSEPAEKDLAGELYRVAALVDTTLFRSYTLTRPRLAGSLFRLDNFCDPEVVKEKLYESGRYEDLIDFLHGKKLHQEALQLLERFGKGEADAGENLRGPKRTVAYLQQLPFEMIELILQYSKWPLEANPDLGMEVFVADTENAESLPRDRVLLLLQQINARLAMRYLEHVINELGDVTPEFHEELITFYLKELSEEGVQEQNGLAVIQENLEKLLRNSRQYNKTKTLKELSVENARFFESRAIILSRLSNYKAALQIYVFQMRDSEKAEAYCNQIYLSTTTAEHGGRTEETNAKHLRPYADGQDTWQTQSSIYSTLLSLYLAPPNPYKPNLAAALGLLSHHGSRLSALSTLDFVPGSLAVKELELYFQGQMRAANSLARERAIVAALSSVEKTRWEAALSIGAETSDTSSVAAGRNRRVRVGEKSVCSVCGKRFGKAVIRVWPDGDVVHYGCSEKKS